MDTQKSVTCRYHHDRPGARGEEWCLQCILMSELIHKEELVRHRELLAKHLSYPKERLVWCLDWSKFAETHPHLLKEKGLWQASYLLSHFGEDCLTGLAAYFSSLGDDLRERADRRDRATRLAVAEQDQILRELYPPERYQQRVDEEKLEDLL